MQQSKVYCFQMLKYISFITLSVAVATLGIVRYKIVLQVLCGYYKAVCFLLADVLSFCGLVCFIMIIMIRIYPPKPVFTAIKILCSFLV